MRRARRLLGHVGEARALLAGVDRRRLARLGHAAHRDLVDRLDDAAARLRALGAEVGRAVARRLLVGRRRASSRHVARRRQLGARAVVGRRRVVVGLVGDGRLERPAERGEHQDRRADDADQPVVDHAVADDRQRRRRAGAASTTATACGCGGRRSASCSARISSAVATRRRSWASPSPTSSYLRWKNSSRACTVGRASKLCSFGGFVVIHSSVRASHGSSGAAGSVRCVCTTLIEEQQHADGEDERADRGDQVPEAEVEEALAGTGLGPHVHPARLALQADDVHRPERQVHADRPSARSSTCRASRSGTCRTPSATSSRSRRRSRARRRRTARSGSGRRCSRCRSAGCPTARRRG